jgi:hypothetical protein
MFKYTEYDMANKCNISWEDIRSNLVDMGLLIFNNLIGEYDPSFAARPFYEVREFKIYWSDEVLEYIRLKIF